MLQVLNVLNWKMPTFFFEFGNMVDSRMAEVGIMRVTTRLEKPGNDRDHIWQSFSKMSICMAKAKTYHPE